MVKLLPDQEFNKDLKNFKDRPWSRNDKVYRKRSCNCCDMTIIPTQNPEAAVSNHSNFYLIFIVSLSGLVL